MVGQGSRQLRISKQAQKAIMALPAKQRERIKHAVARLLEGDTAGMDIKPLAGHPNEYRLRVGGIRVLFIADAEMLFIFKAGPRGDAYK